MPIKTRVLQLPINAVRGAALTEYGLLAGLIAVVAIGSVSQLGGKVDESFASTSAFLKASLSSDSDGSVETSNPHTVIADWSITAAEFAKSVDYEPSTIRGYAPFWDQTATKDSSTGAFEMQSIYTIETDDPNTAEPRMTRVQFFGDQTGNLTPDMAIRCSGTDDIASLGAATIRFLDTADPQRTVIRWDGLLFQFEAGQSYSCEMLQEN